MSLSFLIFSLLEMIDYNCFNNTFYQDFYVQNNTAAQIGISEEDLNEMTDTLLAYLRDDREDISVKISDNGQIVEGFNDREKAHMVDVKILYENVMTVRNILFITSLVCAIYMFINKTNHRFKDLKKMYLNAFGFLMAIILALGTYIITDFNSFWTNFHHVFFSNDLWLLNPATDRLIMMVPLNFFYTLVSNIIIMTIAIWAFAYFIIWLLERREIND